jgi:hypothetical protein
MVGMNSIEMGVEELEIEKRKTLNSGNEANADTSATFYREVVQDIELGLKMNVRA